MKLEITDWSAFIFTTLGAFGGWAVVVAALMYFLGEMFAKRALQREAARLSKQIAAFGHEWKLRESSYSKHLALLLDYYASFYRHYRLCQNAANQDALKMPDGSIVKTRDTFFEHLEQFRAEMRNQEGKARLLLPAPLLLLHEDGIAAFNLFKDAMKRERYDTEYHETTHNAFAKVVNVKERLEAGLRDFLRTEHLLNLPK